MTTFYSPNALVAQRASGYKNTTYALAELVDNSFDAEAENVTIIFLERRHGGRRRVDEILVFDDGKGMTEEVQQSALQFGNTTNIDLNEIVRSKKKGKFGFGLPNASLSQCHSVHVYSWTKDSERKNYVYLDLEEVMSKQSIDIPKVQQVLLPAYYGQVLPKLPRTGTIVGWRKCDRLTNTKGETLIRSAEALLGRLYRYSLRDKKTITCLVYEYSEQKNTFVQTKRESIKPFDPLFLMADTQLETALRTDLKKAPEVETSYSKFLKKPSGHLPTNIPVQEHCYTFDFDYKGRAYKFQVVTSIADIDIQKPGVREGGNTIVGSVYGEKQKEGNICFVRAEREIASGIFGGFYTPTEPRHRWWSIEVRFDADSDDLLGVWNNKQGIEFTLTAAEKPDGEELYDPLVAELIQARQALWAKLTNVITNAQKEAFKRIRTQATEWDSKHASSGSGKKGSAIPTGTGPTNTAIRKVDGVRPNQLDVNKRRELSAKLSEKYPRIALSEIDAAVELLDSNLTRACVLYAPADASTQLWSVTPFYTILLVIINTNHEFYMRFLGELRSSQSDGAVSAVELFLSSLAVEENRLVTNDAEKDIIEQFRSNVGAHLHRYIKSLPASQELGIFNQAGSDGEQ